MIGSFIAKLILWTPVGDIPGVCDLHWWAVKLHWRISRRLRGMSKA